MQVLSFVFADSIDNKSKLSTQCSTIGQISSVREVDSTHAHSVQHKIDRVFHTSSLGFHPFLVAMLLDDSGQVDSNREFRSQVDSANAVGEWHVKALFTILSYPDVTSDLSTQCLFRQ